MASQALQLSGSLRSHFHSPGMEWVGWVGREPSLLMVDLSTPFLTVRLPAGVPAQEKAPAKLIVYLQRFRPQDYQRLLESNSSRERPQGTKHSDSSLSYSVIS
jgi:hypothetical protein